MRGNETAGQIRIGDHKKLLHFIHIGESRRNIKKALS